MYPLGGRAREKDGERDSWRERQREREIEGEKKRSPSWQGDLGILGKGEIRAEKSKLYTLHKDGVKPLCSLLEVIYHL